VAEQRSVDCHLRTPSERRPGNLDWSGVGDAEREVVADASEHEP